MKSRITLLVAFALALFTSTDAFAQIIVTSGDDDGAGTLRQAIIDTPDGGVITFAGVSTVNLNSELVIDKALTITGVAGPAVTIDANANGRIFNITSGNVILNDLILTNGLAENGGAIYLTNASLTVNDCIISNNIADGTGSPAGSGGGIFNDVGGVLSISNTDFDANLANRAGGGIEDNSGSASDIILTNVNFDGNDAGAASGNALPGNGGALHISGDGNVVMNNGSVTNNVAAKEGGGLWNGSGTMTLNGVEITDNSAIGNATGGGGLFNNGGTLTVDAATTLTRNIAAGDTPGGRGGAIFNNDGGTLNLANGLNITGNYASRAGGAIEDNSNGTLTLSGVVLSGNAAGVDIGLGNAISPNPGNGGAVHLSGTTNAVVDGFTDISNNLAASEGGGLWNNAGTMNVSLTIMDNNIASGDDPDHGGGAIYNNGGTLIVGNAATLSNNIADGAAGSGGAILSTDGLVTIEGAVMAFNRANRAGGAIEIIEGTLDISGNFNISENNAGVGPDAVASPGNGGGLHITGSADATITGGEMSENLAASEGGALWNSTGTMTVDGTLIDSNDAQGAAADNGGGGIFNNGGTLIVQNSTTITSNLASGSSGSGGGVFSTGGAVTISSSEISSNVSNRAGGGIEIAGGTLNLENVNLDDNNTGVAPAVAAPGNGGGLHVSGAADVDITGGTVNGNVAAKEGGGLWNNQGVLTISGTTISGNDAQGDFVADPLEIVGGGGIFAEDGVGSVVINEGTTISGNYATGAQGSGGGILMATGTTLTINGTSGSPVTISDNAASRAGGGLEDWSLDTNTNTLTFVNFTGNTVGLDNGMFTANGGPGNGGAIHVTGPGNNTITGGSAVMNLAANEGGGLWNGSGTMSVIDHTVDANTASGNDTEVAGAAGGGGIFNEGGTLDLSGSTAITNNIADGAQSTGGGILNAAGTMTANGISITGNSSNRAGGGIETNGDSSVELTDVNLDNNITGAVTGAGAPGNGGGLHVSGPAPVTITGGTVNGNVAAKEGGGLWNNQGVLTISGTTISGNDAQGDFVADPLEIVGGGGIFAEDGAGSVVINEGRLSQEIMRLGHRVPVEVS